MSKTKNKRKMKRSSDDRDALFAGVVYGRGVPLVKIDIGLLANQVGVSTTDTLDLGHGVHDLLLAIDLLHCPSVSAHIHMVPPRVLGRS
jgi:hypothetical protein